MISERKLHANRADAQKSSGPKTEAGKRTSSRNALTHRFTAVHCVIDEYEKEHFAQFPENLTNDLIPRNQLELSIVDNIISCAWRLNRILRLESEALRDVDQSNGKGIGEH